MRNSEKVSMNALRSYPKLRTRARPVGPGAAHALEHFLHTLDDLDCTYSKLRIYAVTPIRHWYVCTVWLILYAAYIDARRYW